MSQSLSTIPADFYVNVTPGVISAGPPGLAMIEVMLTTNTRVPIGQVLSFPNAAAVAAFFGSTSNEAASATVYFNGYNLATSFPAALLFAQYPTVPVGAYLRGGSVASLTLTQLQALAGVLTITIDGTPHTSGSINLSTATSFSDAAAKIQTALGVSGPQKASFTGSMGFTATGTASGTNLTLSSVTGIVHPGTILTAPISGTGVPASTFIVSQTSGSTGGAGVYVTNQVTTASTAAITGTSTFLDVTGSVTGAIAVGQQLNPGTLTAVYITGFGTGSGTSSGSYTTNSVQGVASASLITVTPGVTYDSQSGGFVVVSSTTGAASTIGYGSGTISAGLRLTQATGAVLSQGAIAAVPGSFMDALTLITTNWATFQTLFDPDAGSGNAQKQLFAAWVNGKNNRYMYICWDTDITPTQSTNAATSLGQILKSTSSSGTALIYEVAGVNSHLAAFLGGFVASINFNATNGRATADYKSQSGIVPSVTDATTAANLLANGYNYYGSVATAGAAWQFFDNGQVSGEFEWIDTFVNQIWLNGQCQVALMTLLTTLGRIPYNPAGYGMIRTTLTAGADGATVALPPPSPVAGGLNNGVITPNVPLSSTQILEVNSLAGMSIDKTLSAQGWYLIIQPATPAVRSARNSPTVILLYMDGGSIQRINLSSFVVL